MTTAHQDSLAAFFGRSPLSAVHQGAKEFCYSVIFFSLKQNLTAFSSSSMNFVKCIVHCGTVKMARLFIGPNQNVFLNDNA